MTAPFSDVMDAVDTAHPNTPLAPFIRNYVNLLCFLLSGLPADGTITAETGKRVLVDFPGFHHQNFQSSIAFTILFLNAEEFPSNTDSA